VGVVVATGAGKLRGVSGSADERAEAGNPVLRATESAPEVAGVPPRAVAQDGAEPSPPPIGPGDCLGHYTLRTLIGAGGMGQVFAATDNRLERTVALKVIRPDRRASSAARARLLREAQALAALQHPNVVTVHDVGADGEQVYLAMELVEGPTLDRWLLAAPRGWRAIRDVFVAAGRGLAAAHAAGIVHRDFKPNNVIVGAGRVVVVDFGLARAAADAADAPHEASPHDALGVALTGTGERVGTPRYMAPEQHTGDAVTAKADQFAFCVALHHALFGDPPAARARGSEVPRFVAAALARGLAPRAADRWPSMEALLAVLGKRFWTPRRTRLAGALAVAVVAAGAMFGFTLGRRAGGPQLCTAGEAMVASLWDAATRTAVREAFRGTGSGDADAVFARVDAGLRERLGGWTRSYRDNCEATHVRHEQSAAMLDLRAQCLGRARAELTELVVQLRRADAAVVGRAARAVAEVGDVARCSDPASLGAAIAPPRLELASTVRAMGEEVARVSPLFWLGKWKEARAVGRALVDRARPLGYKPLLARALAQLANVETNLGEVDVAISELYEAAQLGTEVGDDDVVATALPWLVFALGNGRDRYQEADAVYRWAEAAVARAGNTPLRLVSLLGNRAAVLGRKGDHEGALALYRRLLVLETARRGADSIGVAWAHKSIGDELVATGRSGDAKPYFQHALTLGERLYGPDHPIVAGLLIGAGWNLVDLLELEAGARLFQRALAIYERSLGPDDLRVAGVLYNLGVARLGQRQLADARAALERALAIYRAKEPRGRDLGQALVVLSEVVRREGHPQRALGLAQQALAIHVAALGAKHEEVGIGHRLSADHLLALGRTAEARAAITRALEIDEAARGKHHPEVAAALVVQGDVLRAERRAPAAVAAYERALRILEQVYGANHAALCEPLAGLIAAQLDAGEPRRALELATRAVALAAGAPPGELERARFRLAQAQWALGVDRPGAQALARQARAGLAALAFPSEELPRIDRWLASAR
jgi:eukaryotic-like serine/threonine-protein kinase